MLIYLTRYNTGDRLNIKISFYRHRDSHYKDEAGWRPSHLYNGNTYIRKDVLCIKMAHWMFISFYLTSICWIGSWHTSTEKTKTHLSYTENNKSIINEKTVMNDNEIRHFFMLHHKSHIFLFQILSCNSWSQPISVASEPKSAFLGWYQHPNRIYWTPGAPFTYMVKFQSQHG